MENIKYRDILELIYQAEEQKLDEKIKQLNKRIKDKIKDIDIEKLLEDTSKPSELSKALEKVGAAKIILDKDINGQKLNTAIEDMVLNKDKMKKMGENALKISTIDAEDKIYEEIKKLVK